MIKIKSINNKEDILYFLNLLCGFCSLFFIPKFYIFNLANLSVFFALFVTLIFIVNYLDRINIKYTIILFFFLTIFFIISSIFGVMDTAAKNQSIISSFSFFFTFIFVLISRVLYDRSEFGFYKGFVVSSIITAIWVIADFLYFQSYHSSINEAVFPVRFLDVGHIITHIFEFNGIFLYKPAGFSWDPGISVTAVVLAYAIIDQKLIKIKKILFVKLLFIVAVLLSLSLTAIITLVCYLIAKWFICFKYIKFGKYKIYLITLVVINILILLFYISNRVDINTATNALEGGKLTHLKYLSGILSYGNLPINKFLFGFGFRGVGEFYNKYVPWFTGYFDTGLTPESALTNIFFIAGVVGAIFYCISIFTSYVILDYRYKYMLFVLLLLSFGYGVNSTWFNITVLNIFYSAYKKLALITR